MQEEAASPPKQQIDSSLKILTADNNAQNENVDKSPPKIYSARCVNQDMGE